MAGAETEDAKVELVAVQPNGITADAIAQRAVATNYRIRSADAALRAAAAAVDHAWAAFLPTLTATARYTRLSKFTPPPFGTPPGTALVLTNQPDGTQNPSPTFAQSVDLTLRTPVDNYLLQASILVPLSDYFLKIAPSYAAADDAQEAARYDALAARARAASEGKLAFFAWLRARGAIVVATQALADQKAHLADANVQQAVGNASRADVRRAEASVAVAELQVERTSNLARIAEEQVRIAAGMKANENLAPGEGIDAPLQPVTGSVPDLTREGLTSRYELKSLELSAMSADESATVAKNAAWPSLSGFGNAVYANPNYSRTPLSDSWFPTWQLGAQLVWSPNDVLLGTSAGRQQSEHANQLRAEYDGLRQSVQLEVLQGYEAVKEADLGVATAERELDAARDAYRVARELFRAGQTSSLQLTDAETELTRARLDVLNSRVDGRVARVRLEHALGRDTKGIAAPLGR